MTTTRGMKAKTVRTAFISAKGTEIIASSTSRPADSRAITGIGATTIPTIGSAIADHLTEAASSAHNVRGETLVFLRDLTWAILLLE